MVSVDIELHVYLLPSPLRGSLISLMVSVDVKGPRKAVLGYKIAPDRFKTTYRFVQTEEETLLLTCLKLFQGFD